MLTPDVLEELRNLLRGGLGDKHIELDRVERLNSGAANEATHLKAIAKDGRVFGLKYSNRMAPSGTHREYLTALTARALGLPGAGGCCLINVPVGVPHIGGKEVVVLEWLRQSEQVAKLTTVSAARGNCHTAMALGGWIWLAIHLGIGDRHLGNWVWSEAQKLAIMIDCEEWTPGNHDPTSLRGPIQQIIGVPLSTRHVHGLVVGIGRAIRQFEGQFALISSQFQAKGEIAVLPRDRNVRDIVRRLTGL